ncbi:chromatin remodeling regulator CECR2-like [Bolinopsis microptera]|uniref:chromatin remodeling regulator CECR2-like n=1 Tax=Bolinopsis microptera TaxID=2820187 RepID=UPI00307ADE15
MKDVQGWWEVPSICYYCSLLGNAFGLPDFTIERLEEALSTEEEDVLLTEMFTTLTQAILPEAVDKSWREKVAYLFSDRGKSNPFEKSEIDKTLTCWEKLDILYNLCEMRMECADVNGIIKTIEKWQLKTLPIGEDSNEMLYWYFCGTRIYRQDRSVEHLERKSARRSVKRQKSTSSPALIGMNGLKKYAYETLLKLTDTPRSNLIKEDEGHEHWTVATSSHHQTQLFTARFETSTEPEEETLYRNLVKVVLPKIDIVVAEQERKEMLAGERKGLTRSGRKVVARYKNGFVASADQESSDNKSDPSQKEKEDLSKRQSKRRRTQPPSNTPVRRSSRHNSDILSPGKKEKSKERATPARATSRTTRRSSKLEEFTEPPSTDTDDEVDENEDEENDKEEEDGAEEEEEPEKKSPTKERPKQVRKPGTTPVRRRGPGRPGVIRPTIRDQIAEALLLRDKDRKGKTKHLPTGEGDPDIVDRLSDVMATLTRHPEAWQFNEPVNEDFAPYYYTLIENPKDFNMIERSAIDRQYKSVSEFVDNINLVFTNCYDYNGPINEYTRAARVLEKYFRRLMRELCREDYTFDGHSVIYPGKRLFVNRHKRIKALKLAGVIVLPQKSKPSSQDDSSRDSNTGAFRPPEEMKTVTTDQKSPL